MKCTSQLLSSCINFDISLLNFDAKNLSPFCCYPENMILIRSFEEEATDSNRSKDVSSLFLSRNPFVVYSTSLAVWAIINVGSEIRFGFFRS